MKLLLAILYILVPFPGVALAAPETGFWEFSNSMMSGMGWMMLPMMIMPFLLLTILVLAIFALIKFLRSEK